jgi:small-conductance mechanosensitive channel
VSLEWHRERDQHKGAQMEQFLESQQTWLVSGGILVGAVILTLIGHAALFLVLGRVVPRTADAGEASLIRHTRGPARAILPLLAILLVLPEMRLSPHVAGSLEHVVSLALIVSVGWLTIGLTRLLDDLVSAGPEAAGRDPLAARQIQTRVRVIRRVAAVLIGVLTSGAILMTFPSVRHLGTSLASAGLLGLVAGIAARPVLSNLLAGVQIALAQPMRLEDVVVVEGEWGWIEEIYTTYVVVRIWDLRRLVVPLSYFIERPFQNWTRRTTNLLATVFIYADYTVPVEALRQELHRLLLASGMWDGKVWGLQVTDATEHTVQLRALMSARDSGNAWDLRCHVREELIELLQHRYPGSLPRTREATDGGKP